MATTYLSRTPSSAGNRKTFTFSTWFKLGSVDTTKYFISSYSASSDSGYTHFSVQNNNKLHFAGNTTNFRTSTQLLRDLSAWYHVVLAVDTTQATASDRIKIYLNGSQITDFTNNNNPNQNDDFAFNQNAIDMVVGSANAGGSKGAYWDGSMAHVHWIDGIQYQASDFGETDATTGIWKPKTAPSVTYGTNGFFLKFENSGAFGTDSSGNGNNFTVNGTMTQTIDTPSNVFATLNPLMGGLSNVTYSNGNTTATFGAPSTWYFTPSTLAASQGKWYAEVKVGAVGTETSIGIIPMETVSSQQGGASDPVDYMGKESDSIGYVNNGQLYKTNSVQETTSTYTTGDIIGMAFDLDGNSIQFYKNGSSVGSAISLTSGLNYTVGVSGYNSSSSNVNFGNGYFGTTAVASAGTNASGIGIFEHDVPNGYTSLSTKGLNL